MIMPENLPSGVWALAWNELYKLYNERLDPENVDIMDSIFQAVVADTQEEIARCSNEPKQRGPD